MSQVSRCSAFLCKVVDRASAGVYGRGLKERFYAYSFLGGPVIFWLRLTLRAGAYGAAWRLFLRGIVPVVAVALRKTAVRMSGKKRLETLTGLSSS